MRAFKSTNLRVLGGEIDPSIGLRGGSTSACGLLLGAGEVVEGVEGGIACKTNVRVELLLGVSTKSVPLELLFTITRMGGAGGLVLVFSVVVSGGGAGEAATAASAVFVVFERDTTTVVVAGWVATLFGPLTAVAAVGCWSTMTVVDEFGDTIIVVWLELVVMLGDEAPVTMTGATVVAGGIRMPKLFMLVTLLLGATTTTEVDVGRLVIAALEVFVVCAVVVEGATNAVSKSVVFIVDVLVDVKVVASVGDIDAAVVDGGTDVVTGDMVLWSAVLFALVVVMVCVGLSNGPKV